MAIEVNNNTVRFDVEEADLEELASRGEKPPNARFFIIKIDGVRHRVERSSLTGRELLVLAGKAPPEKYRVFERYLDKKPHEIQLEEVADFTKPGVECFATLPRTSPDGETPSSRQFRLPIRDERFLESTALAWETVAVGSERYVLLSHFALPEGYTTAVVDMGVTIPLGYPEAALDMAFFSPPLARLDGKPIQSTSELSVRGKTWQMWSRHRPENEPKWRPGLDDLALHLTFVRAWLEAEITRG